MKKSAFDIRAIIRPDLLELPGYVPITPSDVLAEELGIARDDVIKLDGNDLPNGRLVASESADPDFRLASG